MMMPCPRADVIHSTQKILWCGLCTISKSMLLFHMFIYKQLNWITVELTGSSKTIMRITQIHAGVDVEVNTGGKEQMAETEA